MSRSSSLALGATLLVAATVAPGTPLAAQQRPTAEGRAQPPGATLSARLAAGERAAIARLPRAPARQLVLGGCLTCHSASIIVMQRKDSTAWDRTVTTMIGWGATVPPKRKAELVAYLARHFPARAAGPAPAAKP